MTGSVDGAERAIVSWSACTASWSMRTARRGADLDAGSGHRIVGHHSRHAATARHSALMA